MIYEFAVDPAVAAAWYDPGAYRFFKGAFGLGKRRVLARYPGTKWKRLVMQEFHEIFRDRDPVQKQNAKLKLDALLRHLTEASSSRNRPCSDPWAASALAEHERRNFQGILVKETGDGPFINAAEVDDDHPRWNPAEVRVNRSASAITTALIPLLRHARRLVFIDPYIEPGDKRFSLVLTKLVASAQQGRADDEGISVAVHTSVDREFKAGKIQTAEAERREAEDLVGRVREMLLPKLDAGASLAVTIWSNKNAPVQDELVHNRYVLCERGGLMFGHGLDAGNGRETITVLSAHAYREVDEIYQKDSKAMRLVTHAEFASQ